MKPNTTAVTRKSKEKVIYRDDHIEARVVSLALGIVQATNEIVDAHSAQVSQADYNKRVNHSSIVIMQNILELHEATLGKLMPRLSAQLRALEQTRYSSFEDAQPRTRVLQLRNLRIGA